MRGDVRMLVFRMITEELNGGERRRQVLLSIVVPMYNEQEVLPETYRRLTAVCQSVDMDYEILFVDDCSKDGTMRIAREILEKDGHVRLLSVARNGGQMIALTAGLDYARGDCAFIIDADLQDPPELLPAMLEKWREGYEVVYGRRTARKGETFLKKATASMYYRVVTAISGFPIPEETSDFRVIDRKVIDALKQMPERNRYLRGMIAWIGYKQTPVEFIREERFAGETKYTLKKMLRLAADGIFSFSSRPVAFFGALGALLTGGGLCYLLGLLLAALLGAGALGTQVVVAVVLFVGGLILCGIATVGGYIGRIFDNVKGRPLYFLSEKLGFDDKEDAEP